MNNKAETPDTVHGRLMESVHIAGYSFERACGELDWLLDRNRWRECGRGFKHIDAFLATLDYTKFKVSIEQRKSIAKKLADLGAGQRATARLIGVDKETIRGDLGLKARGEKSPPTVSAAAKTAGSDQLIGELSPAWFQADVDPSNEAKRVARRELKPEIRAEKLAATIWPAGKYGVILGDPPWKPDAGLLDPTRQIENQYPTASLDELIAMRPQIDALALDDCVLLLWTTTQKLGEAKQLIDAWGFVIKSGAVWIKPSVGMGYWFRGRHELLVLATRGTPATPLEADRPDSVIEAKRAGHSEKPDVVYELIERMFPSVPKVEIFARAIRDGWSRATNEKQLRRA